MLRILKLKWNCQAGMTMAGALVAIAITAIAIVVLISVSVNSHRSMRNVDQLQQFMQLMSESSTVMRSGPNGQCSANMKAALNWQKGPSFAKANEVASFPISISYFKPDLKSVARTIIAKTPPELEKTHNGIYFKSITVVPKANLADNKAIFEIQVVAQKTGDVASSKVITHSISVFATLDANGFFVDCGSGNTSVEDRVCGLLSGGIYSYDAATGACVQKHGTVCYPSTNPDTATCLKGKLAAGVSACATTAVEPGFDSVKRDYQDDSVEETRPRHFRCRAIDETNVRCIYAKNVNQAGSICSACCIEPNL